MTKPPSGGDPFSPIFNAIMEANGLEVKDVCKALDRGDTWVCQVRGGQLPPTDEVVVKFARAYAPHRLWELLAAAAALRIMRAKPEDKSLQAEAIEAWKSVLESARQHQHTLAYRTGGARTLDAFPNAFYPLAVIGGDKREGANDLETAADVGVVSASQSELRWAFRLGLNRETDFFPDKILVLETTEQLKERFARKNLLVIGSALCNHFARHCHLRAVPDGWRRAVPIHRFNAVQERLAEIDAIVRSLRGMSPAKFKSARHDPEMVEKLAFLMNNVLNGGIVDPAYKKFWLRAGNVWHRDFGHVTLARNPFAEDDEFVCILAAGFHWRGTACALRLLSEAAAGGTPFATHPLGGIIRVRRPSAGEPLDQFDGTWDAKSDYSIDDLETNLETLASKPPTDIQVTAEEYNETLAFVRSLRGTQ